MPSTPEATSVEVAVERWASGRTEAAQDRVAEEVPVALVYHGVPHVVMLASPADLEDYAVGFTVSEGLVASASEIQSVEVASAAQSIEVRIGIAAERFSALLQRRRNLTGRTGCGLCGTETLDQAIRPVSQVPRALRIAVCRPARRTRATRIAATGQLAYRQRACGGLGRAARGDPLVREDVGRHNALDKAIGALLRAKADVSCGYMIITSRASYEMVQKSATAGIALVAAVSAPTALAIRIAQQSGVTLVGFARRDRHVVYAHPERLVDAA